MAFKKRTSSLNVEPLNSELNKSNRKNFPVGTRFMIDSVLYVVVEEFESDNAHMRRINADNGNSEILSLKSLQKDMKTKTFKFVD